MLCRSLLRRRWQGSLLTLELSCDLVNDKRLAESSEEDW